MAEAEHSKSLRELGEDAVVSKIVSKLPAGSNLVVGAGDDCAAVKGCGPSWELLKTDCLVEGVHFHAGTDPKLVGRKAMNRVLSDIAAMGGIPAYALVTVATDGDRKMKEVEGWYEGLLEAASRHGCLIVGGETSRLNAVGAFISVSLTGFVEPTLCVQRNGASIGDSIAVTGRLGGSLDSGKHLTFEPRIDEARWLVENHRPTAMMDLSDGLGADLPRLAKASGVGYRVNPASIPRPEGVSVEKAIGDGEDYELLLTFPSGRFDRIQTDWSNRFPAIPLTAIGEMVAETEGALVPGWDHYRSENE